MRNVVLDFLIRTVRAGVITPPTTPVSMTWTKATDGIAFSTGWFNVPSPYLDVDSKIGRAHV